MTVGPATRALGAWLGAAGGGDVLPPDPESLDGETWDAVLLVAGQYHLQPALWTALVSLGLFEPVPEDALAALVAVERVRRHPAIVLQQARAENDRRTADLLDQLATVLATLDDAGIDAVVLKGAASIARRVYADRADRVMADLDVLVPRDRAGVAQGALVARGWAPADERERFGRDHHQLEVLRNPERFGSIEVHVAPVPRGWAGAITAGNVRSAARPVVVPWRTSPVLVPSADHAAVIALVGTYCTDGAWHRRAVPLRTIHELWRLDTAEGVDWASVRGALRRIGRAQLVDEHRVAAHTIFGAPAPATSARTVRARARLELHARPSERVLRPIDAAAAALDAGRLRQFYGADTGGPWRLRAHHAGRQLARLRPGPPS